MIGKTVNHYKILEKLGEGGMGIVYKAEDTKLKRLVALKFLPVNLTDDSEAVDRFINEAWAASALDHGNICTIYEIDETDERQLFICIAYYEGQTLKEKINGSPLSTEEALDITFQISQGLQRAHEAGIIHRDIKPSNIIITDRGEVKIIDFGIAKLASNRLATKSGTTLGTMAYMAPEQIHGETVDHRADIWALGVALFEMLTGKSPFQGDNEAAVIYSIVNEEPEPITALRSGVPIALDDIIARVLAKDPALRYQYVDELRADLKALGVSYTRTSRIIAKRRLRTPKKVRIWLRWILAALVTITTTWWWSELRRPADLVVNRSHILLPESAPIAPIGSAPFAAGRPALAISPDGRLLVYVAGEGGQAQLYLRPLDQFETIPIPGTESAYHPFFSPDGEWIGFFTGTLLKKVAVSGGEPVTLCNVFDPFGASWGDNDRIVFSSHWGSKLWSVSSSGGTPAQISKKTNGFYSYLWPEMLPGGKAALISDIIQDSSRVISLASGETTTIAVRGQCLKFVPPGHLVYAREGRLEAIGFDVDKLEISGVPVPVVDGVRTEADRYAPQYALSKNGTLIYLAGVFDRRNRLVWLDRSGHEGPLQFPPEIYGQPALAPDGKRLALTIVKAGQKNVWIYDLKRGSRFKLTFHDLDTNPAWSPDGKWVVFASSRTGHGNPLLKLADGTGEVKQLFDSRVLVYPESWSTDGKILGTSFFSGGIRIYDAQGGTTEPFTSSNSIEWGADFSPDGKWIAYTSDEQGQFNVYVQPYPLTGERWQISTEGGEVPLWSQSSNELFYRNGRKWMVVSYTKSPIFDFDAPRLLFEGDYLQVGGRDYDVSPDGQRFLLLKPLIESSGFTRLNVVTNWFEELKRKVPNAN